MPDLLTPQVLATAGPLVVETLIRHYMKPKKSKDNKPREDLMYDEAFILMKTLMEIATKHPVAALQRFGLVRTPAPPWVALHRVCIPQHSLTQAAEVLVKAMGGEEMAYKVAGGSKWWQVRAGPGVEGEWIVMKKDWKEANGGKTHHERNDKGKGKRDSEPKSKTEEMSGEVGEEEGMVGEDGGVKGDGEFRKEMDELRCMLYIHGGAYYWGSINTHRYVIWRYARKMHGRCFAVNYRKAPQYPFPCAIQDCVAAWIYLTNPPTDARHKPVDPKNIILAGDSAGGGLCLALLQILRDTGLGLPGGAVLISPWTDLTHSFPSILKNTATDIVPPYGFIHKPSSLWPPPPPALTDEIQGTLRSRVKEAVSKIKSDHRPHLHLHHHDPPAPTSSLVNDAIPSPDIRSSSPHGRVHQSDPNDRNELHPIQKDLDIARNPGPTGESSSFPNRANPALAFADLKAKSPELQETDVRKTTLTQCDAPMRLTVKDTTIEIDTQIQLYATNAQLCHPLVSPHLGYLGGLPPLLVVAGDDEVLRDEIIYIAHKAAHPEDYPLRDDVRAQMPSMIGIEKRHGPSNVHLQVYDGVCHDLPLLSMTKAARGLFRAVASFARYVTPSAPGSLSISKSRTPSQAGSRASSTPNSPLSRPVETDQPVLEASLASSPRSSLGDIHTDSIGNGFARLNMSSLETENTPVDSPKSITPRSTKASKTARFSLMEPIAGKRHALTEDEPGSERPRGPPREGPEGDDAGPRFGEDMADKDSRALPGTAGHSGIYRGENPFTDNMIRERVAFDGACRPLEPPHELAAMQMPQDEIGMIKEGPAIRYLNGQSLWDKKYKHALKTVARHRKKNLRAARERDSEKISKMWEDKISARRVEKEKHGKTSRPKARRAPGSEDAGWETEAMTENEDHAEEDGYQDASVEAEILDQSWSWSWAMDGEAPPPSAIVSRRDFGEARDLAMMADRMDAVHGPPMNGLSIWVGLATFFSNSTERSKAQEALERAQETRRAEESGRGTLPGQSPIGRRTIEQLEKRTKGVGRIFGFGK